MNQEIYHIAAQLTPYTTPAAYAGAILLFVGCLALLAWVIRHRGTSFLRMSGRLLILLGVFFLVFQATAMALGLDTTANFDDAWIKIARTPFWLVGVALLVPGFILRILGAIRPTH